VTFSVDALRIEINCHRVSNLLVPHPNEWVVLSLFCSARVQQVVRSLRSHRPLLLNWFRAKGSLSAVDEEGFNGKAEPTMKEAYGYRTPEALQIATAHETANLNPLLQIKVNSRPP